MHRVEFHRILDDALQPFPESVRKGLDKKFEQVFDDPMLNQVEHVIQKRITKEYFQYLLFDPKEEHYHLYVKLIQPQHNIELKKVQKFFLSMFYLKHVHNWKLVTEFILQVGRCIIRTTDYDRQLKNGLTI